jgi:hypothetical protein
MDLVTYDKNKTYVNFSFKKICYIIILIVHDLFFKHKEICFST